MDVYVESNFVLEMAFLQEEQDACREILDLAHSGSLRLFIPEFSLSEPYEALKRRTSRRRKLFGELQSEINELSRTLPYRGPSDELRRTAEILTESGEDERSRLNDTVSRLSESASIVHLSTGVLKNAITYQAAFDLLPQDSLVFASVLESLVQTAAPRCCFINRNSRDFDTPDIRRLLDSHHCKLINRFSDGLGYIRNAL